MEKLNIFIAGILVGCSTCMFVFRNKHYFPKLFPNDSEIDFLENKNLCYEVDNQKITLFSQKLQGRYKCEIYAKTWSNVDNNNVYLYPLNTVTKIKNGETYIYGVPYNCLCFSKNSEKIVIYVVLTNLGTGYKYEKNFKGKEEIILSEIVLKKSVSFEVYSEDE